MLQRRNHQPAGEVLRDEQEAGEGGPRSLQAIPPEVFLIFYENNTNFSLSNRFSVNK